MSENLGQHFLQNKQVVKDIGRAAGVETSDIVLEVGPGQGVLTEELLAAGAEVIAVEKDPQLAEALEAKFDSATADGRLKIITKDVRDIDLRNLPEDYKVVANIPYYLTSQLIRQLLTAENQPSLAVLLVQKEVAERITDTEKNSVLSISVKAYGSPSFVRSVDPGCFSPPPKVDSAVLQINGINRDFFADIKEDPFFQLVKAGFAHKRKQLKNNLANQYPKADIFEILQTCNITPTIRAERLTLSNWRCLYTKLPETEKR